MKAVPLTLGTTGRAAPRFQTRGSRQLEARPEDHRISDLMGTDQSFHQLCGQGRLYHPSHPPIVICDFSNSPPLSPALQKLGLLQEIICINLSNLKAMNTQNLE